MFKTLRYLLYATMLTTLLLGLTGCQQVADTRAEFCLNLREVGMQATFFKETRIDQPIADLQAHLDQLDQARKNVVRLNKLARIELIDRLNTGVDQVAGAVGEFKTNQVDPVVEKIKAAAGKVQQAHTDLNDAACAAK